MNINRSAVDAILYRIGMVAGAVSTLILTPMRVWSQEYDPGYTAITATSGVLTAPSAFTPAEIEDGRRDRDIQSVLAMRIVCFDGSDRTAAIAAINNANMYYKAWMEAASQQVMIKDLSKYDCPKGWRARVDSVRTYMPGVVPAYLMALGKPFVKRTAKDFGTETLVDDYYPGGAKTMADLQRASRSKRWNDALTASSNLQLSQKTELTELISAGKGEMVPLYGPVMLNAGYMSKAGPDAIATGANRKYFLLGSEPGKQPVMVFRFHLKDGTIIDIATDCVNLVFHAQMRQVFVTRVREAPVAGAAAVAPIAESPAPCDCGKREAKGISPWIPIGLLAAGAVGWFVFHHRDHDEAKKTDGNHGKPSLTWTVPIALGGYNH